MEKKISGQTAREMYPRVIRCQQIIPKTDRLRNNGMCSSRTDLTTK